jgi:hypothetical protein
MPTITSYTTKCDLTAADPCHRSIGARRLGYAEPRSPSGWAVASVEEDGRVILTVIPPAVTRPNLCPLAGLGT